MDLAAVWFLLHFYFCILRFDFSPPRAVVHFARLSPRAPRSTTHAPRPTPLASRPSPHAPAIPSRVHSQTNGFTMVTPS